MTNPDWECPLCGQQVTVTEAEHLEAGCFRPLHQIAEEIQRSWKNPCFGAVPYIRAMRHLNLITDEFGHDDAEDIVIRFLSNARYWHGPTAKRIKAELKAMLDALKLGRKAATVAAQAAEWSQR